MYTEICLFIIIHPKVHASKFIKTFTSPPTLIPIFEEEKSWNIFYEIDVLMHMLEHFRLLLKELKQKFNFFETVIRELVGKCTKSSRHKFYDAIYISSYTSKYNLIWYNNLFNSTSSMSFNSNWISIKL